MLLFHLRTHLRKRNWIYEVCDETVFWAKLETSLLLFLDDFSSHDVTSSPQECWIFTCQLTMLVMKLQWEENYKTSLLVLFDDFSILMMWLLHFLMILVPQNCQCSHFKTPLPLFTLVNESVSWLKKINHFLGFERYNQLCIQFFWIIFRTYGWFLAVNIQITRLVLFKAWDFQMDAYVKANASKSGYFEQFPISWPSWPCAD